jgi:hypothetical protein
LALNLEKLARKARSELAARIARDGSARFSVEALAGEHTKQLAFMRDRSPWIHVMCARQSGKSWGDDGILLDNALSSPQSTNLLLGLTGTAARTNNWEPIWKRLCERFGIPDEWHNNTRMLTSFPNGARVMFAGTDDITHVRSYLGNRLDNGVVIIDESQSQQDSVLKYLLRNLLPPMLTPTSRVIMSGVLPDVPAGYFYELADDPAWSHHSWARVDNSHTPEAMEQLKEYMRLHNLTENDPQIARDWYMRRVWDKNATAYHYDRSRNGYDPTVPEWLAGLVSSLPSGSAMAAEPWESVNRFAFAIDPGSRDRCSVQGWGWGPADPRKVQHVFDWTSDRGARLGWSAIVGVAKVARSHYQSGSWRYDAGSSQNELDLFQRDHGLPVIRAAAKADFPGQVRRMNDLLSSGRAMVMVGSTLEEDLQKARWDEDARGRGQYRWANTWHPDASEAARYALQGYFEAHEPTPQPKPTNPYDQFMLRMRERQESASGPRGFMAQRRRELR